MGVGGPAIAPAYPEAYLRARRLALRCLWLTLFGISRGFDGIWVAGLLMFNSRKGKRPKRSRQIVHQQIRKALELEKKHSLRICRWLPWTRHTVGDIPLPEDEVLPCNDTVCNGILGTTLLYYVYAHLR